MKELTVQEYAKLKGITKAAVYIAIKKGIIKARRVAIRTKRLIISVDDVEFDKLSRIKKIREEE